MSDIRFAVKAALANGWAVVPLLPGKKATDKPYDETRSYELRDFIWPDGNLAFKNGEPSGWRADIDCDCAEAILLARILLPKTGLIHGRASAPDSHHWYKSVGIASRPFTVDGKTLIEIRSSRRKTVKGVEVITGGYTVVPPSIHEGTGESILWTVERDPLEIDKDILFAAVRMVATGALLLRRWKDLGHHSMGMVSGFLCHAGMPAYQHLEMLKAVADAAGDGYTREVLEYAKATIEKHKSGSPVAGANKLAEVLGKSTVDALRGWFKMADTTVLDEISKKYFVVTMGKHTVIGREDLEGPTLFQPPHEVGKLLGNEFIISDPGNGKAPQRRKAWDVWMESPRSVRREHRQVTFAPPPKVAHGEDYNLWRGYGVEPGDPEQANLMLEHLWQVICAGNKDHFDYLLNLLAITVQQPGTPTGVVTVMRSGQGTGKGMFMQWLMDIFGHHAVHLNQTGQFAGKFNAALSGKALVFADEAFFAGDKTDIGTLKRIITESTLLIERKGFDPVSEPNHVHLFMATNEDWAYPAELDDRRGFILEVAAHRVNDHGYFGALAEARKRGGPAGLLAYLLNVAADESRLLPVPKTKALSEQKIRSLDMHHKWWHDCLFHGSIGGSDWPSEMTTQALHTAYEDFAHRHGGRRPLAALMFVKAMRDFYAVPGGKTRRPGKAASNRARTIELRALDDARLHWDKTLGVTTDWPEVSGTSPF